MIEMRNTMATLQHYVCPVVCRISIKIRFSNNLRGILLTDCTSTIVYRTSAAVIMMHDLPSFFLLRRDLFKKKTSTLHQQPAPCSPRKGKLSNVTRAADNLNLKYFFQIFKFSISISISISIFKTESKSKSLAGSTV